MKIKKMKCSFCGREYHPADLFCLTTCRGATGKCLEEGCIVACGECLRRLRRCLVHLDDVEDSVDELFNQLYRILRQIRILMEREEIKKYCKKM